MAAATCLVAITDVQAQKVTLTYGSTTAECQYTDTTLRPNGSVTVTCTNTITTNGTSAPTPPPPEPYPTNTNGLSIGFSLSTAGGTFTTETSAVIAVRRRGDSGAIAVPYSISGDACATPGDYSVDFGAADIADKPITQAGLRSTGSQCVVSLQSGLREGYMSATFTRASSSPPPSGGGTPPPSGVPAGCPNPPSGMLTMAWQDPAVSTHNYWMAPQNVVVSVAMPTTNLPSSSPNFMWSPSSRAGSPSSGYVRYSVSKCPGQIVDDATNFCNGRNATTLWSQKYVAIAGGSYPTREMANLYGVCWAPVNEGPWYLNFRYEEFQSPGGGACPVGMDACGVLWQHN